MALDYKQIGLKCGLEIHQQLATKKLFCDDPSALRNDKPDFTITRELRPMAGETGQIDIAAVFEKKKRKFYIYEGYKDTTCLVELDEEPPHQINQDALEITLTVARILHCKFPDTVQVMRKTVVDGSNTSAFQRTALIAFDGFIETSFGRVGIQTVCLEEDSGRRITEDQDSVTYRLDRLGIPLIEIATAPDIHTPEQARECAEKLGMLLRSTGKVMRGIGTIRQDLNVSIAGHPRVEIKGVQDLRNMPQIVEKEIERQQVAISSGEKLLPHVRNVKEDLSTKFLRPMPGAARMYPETDHPLIVLDEKHIAGLKLPESFEDKEKRFLKLGLSADLAKQITRDEKVILFETFAKQFANTNANVIASTLLSVENEVKRKLGKEIILTDKQFEGVFHLLNKNKLTKESLLDVFVKVAEGISADDAAKSFEKLSDTDLKKEIEKIKAELKNVPPDKLQGIIIGKLRGRAEPSKIIEALKWQK
ncbi:MAG: Glu-tRNA(Gln) amidotransferase subunit GatE [DPANN group archaeon]|nr:Glu-tRNA(Gln) amidotransferase subunit GatE [DPANN group archaeon]